MSRPDSTTRDWRAPIQRLRVPLGFASSLLFIFFSRPSRATLIAGLPLTILGLLLRGWASGHLRKNRELATGGPYAMTRNPLYFGSFAMVIGLAIAGGTWWLGLLLVGFFLLIYWPVIQAEAHHVESLFGDQYREWAARVPLFIPGPHLVGTALSGPSFDHQQFMRHREYRAAIGVIIVYAILIARIVWQGSR
jgi:protein-S-isoprenylcysteine O-methyltransferase Ste14